MDLTFKKIETVNELLLQNIPHVKNPGLFHGKMGICIYFFHLAHITALAEHQEIAEQLIDEVYGAVRETQIPPDFENGLAGIAWGIEYLVQQGFVVGDTDLILSEVDDRIYRYLCAKAQLLKLPLGVARGVLGYVLYVLSRLSERNIHSTDPDLTIFKRLLIELINQIGRQVEDRTFKMREPLLFDLSWDLPLCLVLLARVRELGFYNTKIDRILESVSPVVISLFPRLQANRLYLLLGMESVLKQVDLPEWQPHALLLKQHIDLTDVLAHGLNNKAIDWAHGAAGVAIISRRLYSLTKDERFYVRNEELMKKIISSEYWNFIEQKETGKWNLGLLFGLAGIGMALLRLIERKQPEEVFNG